jgi:hypothetical protein
MASVDGVLPAALAALSRDVDMVVGGVKGAFPEPEVDLCPAKELTNGFERRPCTSRSALQAYENNVVMSSYSL